MEEVIEEQLLSPPSHMSGKEVFTLTLQMHFCSKFLVFNSSTFPSVAWIIVMIKTSVQFSYPLLHPNACWGLNNPCPIFISTIDFYCLEAHFSYLEHGMIELNKK